MPEKYLEERFEQKSSYFRQLSKKSWVVGGARREGGRAQQVSPHENYILPQRE
jgi:hypothetical protein